MAELLAGLDEVDWASLKGPDSAAVPGQIRALMSTDPKLRSEAQWGLFSTLVHQGTRYQVTPYAIPFLVEILQDPETPDRGDIVLLLTHLALGYDGSFLPNGVNPAEFRAWCRAAYKQMRPDKRAHCDLYGIGPLINMTCYDAVRQGVPVVITLLAAPDTDLRRHSARLLAWFPEHSAESVPRLQSLLARSTEPREQASAILALGLLARNSDLSLDHDAILPYRDERHPLLVRVAAAIALLTQDRNDGSPDILIAAVARSEALGKQSKGMYFNEGNMAGYAGLMLCQMPETQRKQIVAAVCQALERVNSIESIGVIRTLFDLVIGDRTSHSHFFEGRPASTLTPLQRQALLGIVEHGRWTSGQRSDALASWILSSTYGLPKSRAALRAYLEPEGESRAGWLRLFDWWRR
jgi:hypothetical protein